jgi:sorbitol-specific phosphotransferase system component IIA
MMSVGEVLAKKSDAEVVVLLRESMKEKISEDSPIRKFVDDLNQKVDTGEVMGRVLNPRYYVGSIGIELAFDLARRFVKDFESKAENKTPSSIDIETRASDALDPNV